MKKVLVGGRFNIIHPGHVDFLKKAKALGDYLVVVIASDSTVKKNKKSLLFHDSDRKILVESIRFVDKVVVGYDIKDVRGYAKIIKDVKPDIIALGYDQKGKVKELQSFAKQAGVTCKVVRVGKYKKYQTKNLIQ